MTSLLDQFATDENAVQTYGNVSTVRVDPGAIAATVRQLYARGLALKTIEATDDRHDNGCFRIWYVFGVPSEQRCIIPYIELHNTTDYPSIGHEFPAANGYERKIRSMFGLNATDAPDDRAMILHDNWPTDIFPMRKDFDAHTRPKTAKGTYRFGFVEGEGIYEIPVGPIHAGIIEPGHFRFSMAGESIMLLEARLGYVHKGTEKLFEQLDMPAQVRLAEKISGDSSFSHSLAYCQAVENLAGITVPARANHLRSIYAELERIANHFGDIGAIMLDTGFNFGGSQGARLREIMLRVHDQLTGSRFLRGVNTIGGVTVDISDTEKSKLSKHLAAILKDFNEVIDIAENSVSLLNRLKNTGPLLPEIAIDHNALGVPARAAGMHIDTRVDYPYAAYASIKNLSVVSEQAGDVHARFQVRIQEVRSSFDIIHQLLHSLLGGRIAARTDSIALAPKSIAIGLVEGWRGEILHMLFTDKSGHISRVAVRDPSFVNWQVVGSCGQKQIIPDFPLINKSFNLSYTGNDL